LELNLTYSLNDFYNTDLALVQRNQIFELTATLLYDLSNTVAYFFSEGTVSFSFAEAPTFTNYQDFPQACKLPVVHGSVSFHISFSKYGTYYLRADYSGIPGQLWPLRSNVLKIIVTRGQVTASVLGDFQDMYSPTVYVLASDATLTVALSPPSIEAPIPAGHITITTWTGVRMTRVLDPTGRCVVKNPPAQFEVVYDSTNDYLDWQQQITLRYFAFPFNGHFLISHFVASVSQIVHYYGPNWRIQNYISTLPNIDFRGFSSLDADLLPCGSLLEHDVGQVVNVDIPPLLGVWVSNPDSFEVNGQKFSSEIARVALVENVNPLPLTDNNSVGSGLVVAVGCLTQN
jgi:hypothetical protein